jgi:hypothetical protein
MPAPSSERAGVGPAAEDVVLIGGSTTMAMAAVVAWLALSFVGLVHAAGGAIPEAAILACAVVAAPVALAAAAHAVAAMWRGPTIIAFGLSDSTPCGPAEAAYVREHALLRGTMGGAGFLYPRRLLLVATAWLAAAVIGLSGLSDSVCDTVGPWAVAATLTTAEVYNSFLGGPDSGKTFCHGHTYTANPVGCAAALASLDLFEEEELVDRAARLAPRLAEGVRELAELPMVGDVRGIGMVAALELVRDKETKEPLPGTAPLFRDIRHEGLRRGLFLRPLDNVVYLFLPPAVTREALDDILDRFAGTLRMVLR